MSQPVHVKPESPPAGGSERLRLGRLARDAALRVRGVAGTDSGPAGLFVTSGGGQRLEGVTCVAAAHGGYDVSLRLVCDLVPLLELGEQVKAAVMATATMAGLEVQSVSVHIAGLAGLEAP